MKLFFVSCVFLGSIFIEGVPNNYQNHLQSRSIGELPLINWFYKNSSDQSENNEEIEVTPVDEVRPNDEPAEPLEDFLDELKNKAKENGNTDGKTMTLLTKLKATMSETPTNFVQVVINNARRIYNIGASGTSRRTRNVKEVSSLLAPLYALLGLINRLIYGIHLGGIAGSENAAQKGSFFDLLFPFSYLTNVLYGSPTVHQKVLEKIADSAKQKDDSTNDSNINYVYIIDKRHKENADHLFEGKTPSKILATVRKYLNKDNLETEEMFYIVLKVYDLFTDFSKNEDTTNLKLIKTINEVGEDPRFEPLFEVFKKKNEPEFKQIWKLFKKSQSKLKENYESALRKLLRKRIQDYPSQNCFMIGPANLKGKNIKEKENQVTRDVESTNGYRILCIDEDSESKANRLFEGGSNDEVLPKIKKSLDQDDLDPEHAWYTVLKLYQMVKNSDKDNKDENKIKELIAQTGKDPKFENIFENIKWKNDPRLREIQKVFKTDAKNEKEIVESTPMKSSEQKVDPTDETLKHPSINKTELDKDEKNPIPNTTGENVKSLDPLRPRVRFIEKNSEPSVPLHSLKSTPGLDDQHEPNQTLSWFHDPAQEFNARKIRDKVRYYTSKPEVLYSDLDEVENLLKNPSLDLASRHDLIAYVHKWYEEFFPNERIKHKLDELVHLIKGNPEYDQFYETLSPIQRESQRYNEKTLEPLKSLTTSANSNNPESSKMKSYYDVLERHSSLMIADKIEKLNLKNEISYSDLEEVEDLLNNSSLDSSSKRDLINLVHKWSDAVDQNEKMKHKFRELVQIIKENPEYNELYEKLNPAREKLKNSADAIETTPLKKPSEIQIEGMTGGMLDNFLRNVAITLKNPSLDTASRRHLIKLVHSWRNVDNLEEILKEKLDSVINTINKDPDNYRLFEQIRQAS